MRLSLVRPPRSTVQILAHDAPRGPPCPLTGTVAERGAQVSDLGVPNARLPPGRATTRRSAASPDRIRMAGELEAGLVDAAERDLQGMVARSVPEVPDAAQAHDEEGRPPLSDRCEAFRRDLVAIPQPDAKRVAELGYGSLDIGDGKTELRHAEDRSRAELAPAERRQVGKRDQLEDASRGIPGVDGTRAPEVPVELVQVAVAEELRPPGEPRLRLAELVARQAKRKVVCRRRSGRRSPEPDPRSPRLEGNVLGGVVDNGQAERVAVERPLVGR